MTIGILDIGNVNICSMVIYMAAGWQDRELGSLSKAITRFAGLIKGLLIKAKKVIRREGFEADPKILRLRARLDFTLNIFLIRILPN